MLYFGFCPLLRSRSVTTTFSFYSFYSFYISPILNTKNFLKNQYNFVLCVFYSIPTIPLSKYLSSYSFMFWGFLKFLSMYLMATFLQYFPHLPLTFGCMRSAGAFLPVTKVSGQALLTWENETHNMLLSPGCRIQHVGGSCFNFFRLQLWNRYNYQPTLP